MSGQVVLTVARNLGISPSSIHNIIKIFRKSRETSAGAGPKNSLNPCDLCSLRLHSSLTLNLQMQVSIPPCKLKTIHHISTSSNKQLWIQVSLMMQKGTYRFCNNIYCNTGKVFFSLFQQDYSKQHSAFYYNSSSCGSL